MKSNSTVVFGQGRDRNAMSDRIVTLAVISGLSTATLIMAMMLAGNLASLMENL